MNTKQRTVRKPGPPENVCRAPMAQDKKMEESGQTPRFLRVSTLPTPRGCQKRDSEQVQTAQLTQVFRSQPWEAVVLMKHKPRLY